MILLITAIVSTFLLAFVGFWVGYKIKDYNIGAIIATVILFVGVTAIGISWGTIEQIEPEDGNVGAEVVMVTADGVAISLDEPVNSIHDLIITKTDEEDMYTLLLHMGVGAHITLYYTNPNDTSKPVVWRDVVLEYKDKPAEDSPAQEDFEVLLEQTEANNAKEEIEIEEDRVESSPMLFALLLLAAAGAIAYSIYKMRKWYLTMREIHDPFVALKDLTSHE